MVTRYIVTLFGTLWLALTAVAQKFDVMTLPIQQQLPVASVHCIMQDSEGFLWYGTEGGLCRDNGYQTDIFRPTETLRPQDACNVSCVAETADGNILLGSADGLFLIDKNDYHVYRVPLDSTAAFIEALLTDSKGRTWVGTNGRIFLLDSRQKVIGEYLSRLKTGLAASVASFYEDSEGSIFVLQWGGGLLRMRKNETAFSAIAWPIDKAPLQMLEDLRHRCYWVLTSGAGIQRMQMAGDQCMLTAQPVTMTDEGRSHGLSLLRDSQHGLLWHTHGPLCL